MSPFDKFIGIPHQYGESSWSACDCAGLCQLFYREHQYNETLIDGKPIGDSESSKKQPLRMLRYLLKNLDRIPDINDLQYGDIVLLKIAGEHHVAISIDYGKILSMAVPCIAGVSKSTIYRKQYWSQFYIVGFRSRKE
jgi:cell wall-associated NlpC family hydrolase